MKIFQYGLTLLTFTILSVCSIRAESKEVVLLNSYHYGLVWTDGITNAISAELEGCDIVLEVEYMDSKRNSYDQIKQTVYEYLKSKYSNRKVDIVIVTDNNALSLLNEYPEELFPESLVVFCGVNNFSEDLVQNLSQKYTGVVEETDPVGTIDLISKLQPELKKLIVVHGNTPTGSHLKTHMLECLQDYEVNFDIEWWSNISAEELCSRANKLTSDDAMLLLTFNRDSEGKYFDYTDIPNRISKSANVPIYGLWDFYLGSGVVGGKIITSKSQGTTAALLCKQFLYDGVIADIVGNSPNEAIVVYDDLVRVGLELEKVPLDVQVLNRPVVAGDNKIIVLTIGVAIFLVFIFIIFAFYTTSRIPTVKLKLSVVLRNNTVSVLGTTVFLIIAVLVSIEFKSFVETSKGVRNKLFWDNKEFIKSSVDTFVHDIQFLCDFYDFRDDVKTGLLKKYAEDRIFSTKRNDRYFFILNPNGDIIYHPTSPELIGVNYLKEEGNSRSVIIQDMIDVASHPEGGFITYNWERVGEQGTHSKVAYLKQISALGWIIGYGIYLDDVESELINVQDDLRDHLLRSIAVSLFAGFMSFGFFLFISRFTERRISNQINLLNKGIASADVRLLEHHFDIAEFDSIRVHALNVFDEISKSQEKSFVLTRAIEQSPVSIAIIDKNGVVQYVNNTFCRMADRSREDILGKKHKILDESLFDPTAYQDTLNKIFDGGQWVGEYQIEKNKGEFIWQSVSISGVKSDDGEISHVLEVKEDITEKKELQTKLLHSQKLESVGHLAAGVAHEINTPIQFISDNLQFLKDSFQDLLGLINDHLGLLDKLKSDVTYEGDVNSQNDAYKEADFDFLKDELPVAIDQSIDGTRRVAKIVRAMKVFSHPGSDEIKQIDLNETISTTITVTRNEWKYLSTLETEFDDSLTNVPCIASELNQVLLNMIINARDAISDTGNQGVIRIKTIREPDYAVIHISDTGTGIPEDVQTRVFDPFYTTKEVGKGTGQGLSIAHNVIVKKHHGEIRILKSDANGTTFEIRLPLVQNEYD